MTAEPKRCPSNAELAGSPARETLRQRHNPIVIGLNTQRLIDRRREIAADRPQPRLRGDGSPRPPHNQQAFDRILGGAERAGPAAARPEEKKVDSGDQSSAVPVTGREIDAKGL